MRSDMPDPRQGFLMRLLRDRRAATLPMMVAAIFPLAGLVGGGVDMGRMYLTKTRLQQACDAGALGGRKVMAAGTWEANSGAANAAALRFFDSNFQAGDYGTGTRSRAFAENGGTVTGTVSAVVPMTIMRVFGIDEETINVNCSAQLKLPNTDVMFVLDLSGSMARNADNEEVASGPTSRVYALRAATKCFYEVVALINTPEDCGFTPSGGTAPGVQIRFGFVNYGSMVNVGKLLPASALADRWTYQSRRELTRQETVQTPVQTPRTTTSTNTGNPSYSESVTTMGSMSAWTTISPNTTQNTDQLCRNSIPANTSVPGAESPEMNRQSSTTKSGNTKTITTTWYVTLNRVRTEYRYQDWRSSDKRCRRETRSATDQLRRNYTQVTTETTTTTYDTTYVTTTRTVFDKWRYEPVEFDVSAFKSGASSITVPGIGNVNSTTNRASDKVITWDGCIEERKTAAAQPFTTITSNHWDLDIDMAPTTSGWSGAAGSPSGPTGSQWGPALQGIVWARGIPDRTWYQSFDGRASYNAVETTVNYAAGDGMSPFNGAPYNGADQPNSYHCPAESRKLTVWPATPPAGQLSFSDYVNTLQAGGNTYYDVGLIWGARLLSPTGIFGSENAATPSGGTIERHIVFMTDGNVQAQNYNRSSHGLAWYDRRQTGTIATDTQTADQNHRRLDAICAKIKTMPSTTLWVVGFGAAVTDSDTTRLTNCASNPSRYFPARTNDDLKTSFRKIAATISQLKLTT